MPRPAILGLMIAIALGSPALASPAPSMRPIATEAARTAIRPSPASAAEVASYAEREKQDRGAAGYEGGEAVIMGVSATAVVAVLLALILI